MAFSRGGWVKMSYPPWLTIYIYYIIYDKIINVYTTWSENSQKLISPHFKKDEHATIIYYNKI